MSAAPALGGRDDQDHAGDPVIPLIGLSVNLAADGVAEVRVPAALFNAMTAQRKAPPTAWKAGQSGNPAGRTPGVEKVRQLLDPKRDELVAKVIDMALGGDITALRLCIERIAPPPRAESAPVEIPGLADAVTMSDKAKTIIAACGQADISPDTASMLLGAIANAARIIESDELAERIAALEERGLN